MGTQNCSTACENLGSLTAAGLANCWTNARAQLNAALADIKKQLCDNPCLALPPPGFPVEDFDSLFDLDSPNNCTCELLWVVRDCDIYVKSNMLPLADCDWIHLNSPYTAACGLDITGGVISIKTSGEWGSTPLSFPGNGVDVAPGSLHGDATFCDSEGKIRVAPANTALAHSAGVNLWYDVNAAFVPAGGSGIDPTEYDFSDVGYIRPGALAINNPSYSRGMPGMIQHNAMINMFTPITATPYNSIVTEIDHRVKINAGAYENKLAALWDGVTGTDEGMLDIRHYLNHQSDVHELLPGGALVIGMKPVYTGTTTSSDSIVSVTDADVQFMGANE